jgi:hypothetical protein
MERGRQDLWLKEGGQYIISLLLATTSTTIPSITTTVLLNRWDQLVLKRQH